MFGGAGHWRTSPALDSPLPLFEPPQGVKGEDVMVVWDMQNVRTPMELEPAIVCRWLFDTFVLQAGPRRLAGAFGSFTDSTKKAIGEARFNHHSSNGAMNFMMINSPGGPRKTDDSDEPLKEMMYNFTVSCLKSNKDGALVLITADADFVRPAMWCKQQGCVSLELIYYGPNASREIRDLDASWKMEWRDYLDCMMGKRCAWTFPYPQDVAAGLVPQASSSHQQPHHQRHHHHHMQQLRLGPLTQQQRLSLPAAASAHAVPAGGVVGSGGVSMATTHIAHAAQQLLHNKAALEQVVQQYHQSKQTTAVLEQVLQNVAQAAGPVAGTAAAPRGSGTGVFLQPGVQQRAQQGTAYAASGLQPNQPVTVLQRGTAMSPSSASQQHLTWQQQQQQQQLNSAAGVCGAAWDMPSGAAGSRAQPAWLSAGAGASTSGRGAAALPPVDDGGNSGDEDGCFWDGGGNSRSSSRQQQQQHSVASDSSRQHTPHRASSSSVASSALLTAATGDADLPLGADALPPVPSLGLLKRAAGAAAAPGTGKSSGGNLAALLAAAAAGSGRPAAASSPPPPLHQASTEVQHRHHHHHHRHHQHDHNADSQLLSGLAGSSQQQQQQQQRSPVLRKLFGRAAAARPPSPGCGRNDQWLPASTEEQQEYDRHMQHHEQQLYLMQHNRQRPFVLHAAEPADLQAGAAQAPGSSEVDGSTSSSVEHGPCMWGGRLRKGALSAPGMAAAARLLSCASAEAAADASSAASAGRSRAGGVVPVKVMEAPPRPTIVCASHRHQQQQQQQHRPPMSASEALASLPDDLLSSPVAAAGHAAAVSGCAAAAAAVAAAPSHSHTADGDVFVEDEETGEVILVGKQQAAAAAAQVALSAVPAPIGGRGAAVEHSAAAAPQSPMPGMPAAELDAVASSGSCSCSCTCSCCSSRPSTAPAGAEGERLLTVAVRQAAAGAMSEQPVQLDVCVCQQSADTPGTPQGSDDGSSDDAAAVARQLSAAAAVAAAALAAGPLDHVLSPAAPAALSGDQAALVAALAAAAAEECGDGKRQPPLFDEAGTSQDDLGQAAVDLNGRPVAAAASAFGDNSSDDGSSVRHAIPIVLSAPPLPLLMRPHSPVTAIEELGNATSSSSSSPITTNGKMQAAAGL